MLTSAEKPIPVRPVGETVEQVKAKAAANREFRKSIGLAPKFPKTPSKLAEEIAAKVMAPLPRNAVEAAPKGKRAKTLYDTTARPAVKDPVGAIVYGSQNPDAVLAKVIDDRAGERIPGTSIRGEAAGVARAARPLDYLRDRSANPLDPECVAAAEAFIADHEGLAQFGSNTATIIDHLFNAPEITARDRKAKEAGVQIKAGAVVSIPKDASDRIMQAAWRTRRVEQRMQGWEASVLADLLLREYPVGVIARRWGCSPDAASMMVRLALWRLVKVYEETNADFRAWLITDRQMRDQDG